MKHPYYSKRLLEKLELVLTMGTVLVEAPSGYGKTTAVRDYLSAHRKNATVFWLTCSHEAALTDWRCLCEELASIDPANGQTLLRLGFPTADNAGAVARCLRELACEQDAYFVLDNFQNMQNRLPAGVLTALAEHKGANLHMVVITQILPRDAAQLVESPGVGLVEQEDLCFSREDMAAYFKVCGAALSEAQIEQAYRFTEGWAMAVYLQCMTFLQTGCLTPPQGILLLMEQLVWERVSKEQQQFLLRIALFESVTLRQACFLLDVAALPDYAVGVLRDNPFIRTEQDGQRFDIHSILQRLLQFKLESLPPEESRKIWQRYGEWYVKNGMPWNAAAIYYRQKDYGRLLQIPLQSSFGHQIDGVPCERCLAEAVAQCPPTLRQDNPLAMLRAARILYLSGERKAFSRLMEAVAADIDLLPPSARKSTLEGEWQLVQAASQMGDMEAFGAGLERAQTLLTGTSRCISATEPLQFGCPSAIMVLHTQSGLAEKKVAQFAHYLPDYMRLTNGHGAGAADIAAGELAFYRMDIEAAEVACYKAAYLAESTGQDGIRLNVGWLLGRIALFKGDRKGWENAHAYLQQAAASSVENMALNALLLEGIQSLFQVTLQRLENSAAWLLSGNIDERLPGISGFTPRMSYCESLLLRREYSKAVGIAEAAVQKSREMGTVMTEIYYSLACVTGYIHLNCKSKAEKLLHHALALAEPDGLVMPFVEHGFSIGDMLSEVLSAHFPDMMSAVEDGMAAFLKGWLKVRGDEDLLPEKTSLMSKRELDVARLAATGLRNREIAETLFLSESTVKAYLKTIFQKLDIDRRSALPRRMQELHIE